MVRTLLHIGCASCLSVSYNRYNFFLWWNQAFS